MPVLELRNAQHQIRSSPTYKQRRGCRFPPRASRTEGCLGGAPWHSVLQCHEGDGMITGAIRVSKGHPARLVTLSSSQSFV